MSEKIRNFFITNQFFKKIRSFLHNICMPIAIRFLLILLTILILAFVALKFFKPIYLEKASQKASFYFFHYLHLDNRNFEEINISGNEHVSRDTVLEIVKNTQEQITKNDSEDYKPLIEMLAKRIKSEIAWVQDVTVTRNMPNTLNIIISEYIPIAIWQNDGEKYLTDKEGNLIPFEDLEEFKNMVILSGKNANFNAKSLINIFAANPELSARVYSATWVSNRRWDIRFESGLLIKLPEKNISDAWNSLIKIYNMPGSILGLKIIDLRIADKVYLEYDDSVIKELKSL
jgi:cell division protein FtsQ